MTLTSGLVSIICVECGAYLLNFLGRNPKYGVCLHLRIAECGIQFSGFYDLDLLPSF